MMVHCGESRFGALSAPYRVQWLSDNGSIFAAYKTIDITVALNLEPYFTAVESPESDGMADSFVKTFKRDYVRVNPMPDATTALEQIDLRMEDYSTMHPHSQLGYRSPPEYISAQSQPAACPVQPGQFYGRNADAFKDQ
jgi:transposase InsO family protein